MTINLTTTSYLVLGLVARKGTATPYELKQAVFHTIEYFWAFPHSQLYAEPERLQKAGYLKETRERGGRRRRSFSITEKGREALVAWLKEPARELIEIRDLGLLKLYFGELANVTEVRALAQQQAELHRERLAEYEGLCETRQNSAVNSAYPLAVLEMGLLFERAALAFWLAVAADPPRAGKRLQPGFDFTDPAVQGARSTRRGRREKTQGRLPVEIEVENESALNNFPAATAHAFNEPLKETPSREFEDSEMQNSPDEDLPDHLL